jgi:signal transduction histidine kinase/ligand-binding sensor domain-containing protein
MPKQATVMMVRVLFTVLVLVFIASCKNSNRNIPFPVGETEFPQPGSQPLQFSEPKKINWVASNPDINNTVAISRFDLNRLPAEKIEMDIFKPLSLPLTETKLDWSHLPDSTFSLNNLPTEKLRFKISLLAPPKHIRTGALNLKDGATTTLQVFGEEQGLPGLHILSMLRDSKGIMWIGTEYGLCRFDGEYCDTYSIEGINNSQITRLAEDNLGQVWIGTFDGIYVMDPKAGTIKQLTTTRGFGNNQIWGLMKDSVGRIWIGSWGGGVDIVDLQAGTLKFLGIKQGLRDDHVVSFLQTRNGQVWIGTQRGADVIDEKSGKIKHISMDNGLSNNSLEGLLEDSRGQIWFATRNEINILDEKAGIIKHFGEIQGLANNNTRSLTEDNTGQVWIGTVQGGITILNERAGKIRQLGVKEGLSNNDVFSLAKDRLGKIWIGTEGGGINVAEEGLGSITNLKIGQDLNKGELGGLVEDSLGNIWISSIENGVFILDPKAGITKRISNAQGLSTSNIVCLFQNRLGQVWAGGVGGVSLIDAKAGTIKNLSAAQDLRHNIIVSLLEDGFGQVWTGGFGGLNLINPKDGTIKNINSAQGLNSDTVWNLFEDSRHQVWIGTRKGICVIDPASNTIKHIINAGDLSNNIISAVIEDSLGLIWVATLKGLHAIDGKAGTITNFTVKEGLADQTVASLVAMKDKIFAGTPKGLTVITKPAEISSKEGNSEEATGLWRLKSYGKAEGFSDLNFDHGSALLSKDGRFWWGFKNNSLSSMMAAEKDSVIPATYIIGMNVMDKPQYFPDKRSMKNYSETDTIWSINRDTFYVNNHFPRDTSYLKKNRITWSDVTAPYNMPVNLKLPYRRNYLSFHFTGTHLDNPDRTRYRYILEGIDKNWSAVTNQPLSENYRDLPPGKYTFKVASMGFNGLWSHPAELSFSISPPWWKTIWANMVYALIFTGLVWAVIRYRSRKLEKENLRLEEKITRRTAQLSKSLEDLRSTQAQLIQREKMASLGELTAGVAHEIENPLNFVNNFSELSVELADELKQELTKLPLPPDDKASLESLAMMLVQNQEKINHHGKRADAIVKGMLQHSRTSTGKKEPTDINALADEYLRLSFHGLRAKDNSFNATVQTHFDSVIGNVNIIPQDIGRVLLNLYNNAFYAVTEKKKQLTGQTLGGLKNQSESKEDGSETLQGLSASYEPTISVTTKMIILSFSGPKGVEIRISDNGVGIPQKILDKIFQPFFTTKPTGQGTGLGLSLSYDIIKAHGGELKVETVEGEGAAFIIHLPLA